MVLLLHVFTLAEELPSTLAKNFSASLGDLNFLDSQPITLNWQALAIQFQPYISQVFIFYFN